MRGFCTVALLILFTWGCASQNYNAEGMRYFGQAQFDPAITAFQAAHRANPNDPHALYNIAATYHHSARVALRSGQAAAAQQLYEYAAQYYKLCLTKDPNYANAYRGLSALYMDCRDGGAAYQLLENWLNANPVAVEPKLEFARYYQEFSQIFMVQGLTDQARDCRNAAEKYLQQILATDPTNYRALRALGFLKEQSGDIAGAVLDYQRSLHAYPQQKDLEERIAVLVK